MLVAGLEQARDRILRQPVHPEVGLKLAQLARDGDVAAAMTKADRRGEVECALLACAARRAFTCRRADGEPAIEEIVDQRVRLCRISPESVMSTAPDHDELRAFNRGVR